MKPFTRVHDVGSSRIGGLKPTTKAQQRAAVLFTPHRAVTVLRVLTLIVIILLLVFTLGPFQGAESKAGLNDKSAHVIAFYFVALLAFTIAPRTRRTDLALMALALGVLIEVVQGATGRSLSLTDLLSDAAGIAAAMVPTWVERLRHDARRNPFLPFADIVALDRRRSRRRRLPIFQSSNATGGRPVQGKPCEKVQCHGTDYEL